MIFTRLRSDLLLGVERDQSNVGDGHVHVFDFYRCIVTAFVEIVQRCGNYIDIFHSCVSFV